MKNDKAPFQEGWYHKVVDPDDKKEIHVLVYLIYPDVMEKIHHRPSSKYFPSVDNYTGWIMQNSSKCWQNNLQYMKETWKKEYDKSAPWPTELPSLDDLPDPSHTRHQYCER